MIFSSFLKILRRIFLHKFFQLLFFENQSYNCQTAKTNKIQHSNVVFRGKQGVILRKLFGKLHSESAKNGWNFWNLLYFWNKNTEPAEDKRILWAPPVRWRSREPPPQIPPRSFLPQYQYLVHGTWRELLDQNLRVLTVFNGKFMHDPVAQWSKMYSLGSSRVFCSN